MALGKAEHIAFQTRWEGDRARGFGRCQARRKDGKPCACWACGPHGKCRNHKERTHAK